MSDTENCVRLCVSQHPLWCLGPASPRGSLFLEKGDKAIGPRPSLATEEYPFTRNCGRSPGGCICPYPSMHITTALRRLKKNIGRISRACIKDARRLLRRDATQRPPPLRSAGAARQGRASAPPRVRSIAPRIAAGADTLTADRLPARCRPAGLPLGVTAVQAPEALQLVSWMLSGLSAMLPPNGRVS